MAITRLLGSALTLALLVPFAANVAGASAFSSAEIRSDGEMDVRPPFPSHWGRPPLRQTKDLVQLPGGYGRGSGTLRRWIEEKMAEDEANDAGGPEKKWPEKNLVGMTGDDAKGAVLAGKPELQAANVHLVPHDAMVTEDYREDRVRIFVGDDGKVVRQPQIG